MELLKKIRSLLPVSRKKVRKYLAAQNSRLHMGWITQPSLIDADIKGGLTALRARSREEAQNNGYFKGFLRDLQENVVGHQGFQLISKPMDSDTVVDQDAKRTIERHWRLWGKKEQRPELSGIAFKQFCKLMIRSCAQDGEVFVWERFGTTVNEYRYSVQIVEPGAIDVELDMQAPGGNTIKMGIEFDSARFPVAYHVLASEKDLEFFIPPSTGRKTIRVPSEQMIHIFLRDGVWQSRGVPWVHPALVRFNQLGKYEEAELVAARAGASKMGFITDAPDGSGYTGDQDEDEADEDYLYEELEPGVIGRLRNGQTFEGFNPDHPNTGFKDFVKINLRGIAAALGESYNQFSQDLEGVSFGSLRQGALSERSVYMGLQEFLIEEALDRIFANWLDMSLRAGAITNRNGVPLPSARLEKFLEHEWQPRRWDWIDPLKDTTADSLQQKDFTMSRSERIRKRGRQPIEVFQEIAAEDKVMADLGITSAQVDANIAESDDDRIGRLEIQLSDLIEEQEQSDAG